MNGSGILHMITGPVSLRFLRGQLDYLRDAGFGVELACNDSPELPAFAGAEAIGHHHTLPFTREPDLRLDVWQGPVDRYEQWTSEHDHVSHRRRLCTRAGDIPRGTP